MTQTPPTPGFILGQTISWLNQFVRGMTADNWRDMKLQAERQLDDLPAAVAAALSASAEAAQARFAEREAIYKDQIVTGGRVIDELRAKVAALSGGK